MPAERTATLVIRTPEGISFSLHLATPVTRSLALAIDMVAIVLVATVLNRALVPVMVVSADLSRAARILMPSVVGIGYGVALEWLWRGQTIGKRILRLRVVDEQGLRLRFSQVAIRNLLRFIDALPALYMVGGLVCALTRRAQRLGDLAANTIVLREPKIAEPDLRGVLSGKFNSFRDAPHVAARLRQRVEPAEAAIALQAVLRRDQLDPDARTELFAAVADHFREIVRFPLEATEGLSDENYVRNVVDILYTRPGREDARRETRRDGTAPPQAEPNGREST